MTSFRLECTSHFQGLYITLVQAMNPYSILHSGQAPFLSVLSMLFKSLSCLVQVA